MKKKPDDCSFQNEKRLKVNWLVMKLLMFLLFAGSMGLSASSYSQKTKIDLHLQNSSLTDIFRAIENSSEFIFFYNDEVVNDQIKTSVSADGIEIEKFFDQLFKATDIAYKIDDRQVFLYKKDDLKSLESILSLSQQQPQKKDISGIVRDSKGLPLPGVSVVVKGTTTGTITNTNGKFSLMVPTDAQTLVFSFVGMKTQEIIFGNKGTINVTLEEAIVDINEMVVVGYGVQRKATLTGSIVNTDNKEIAMAPVTNVANALTGLLPGVVVKNISGTPGDDDATTILIRGQNTTGDNSPLIVVDGVQDVAGWQRINPNDIESISVLKDASAAIYGSRAANGVILITTKRGTLGKPTVSYSFNQGISTPTRLPKLADAATYADYVNSVLVHQGLSPQYSDAEIQKFKDGSDPLNYPNVNWYKEVLRKSTPQSQQNLSVRGGTETIKYSFSGSYSNEEGIFKNGVLNFETYSIRSNIDAVINKYLKVGFDLNNSYQNRNDALEDFNGLRELPWIPVYWPNGLPGPGAESGQNPAIEATSAYGNNNNKVDRNALKASFDLTIPWVAGLGVDGYFAYNKDETTGKLWQTPWTVYQYDKTNNIYIPIIGGFIAAPQLTESSNIGRSTLYNLRVKYDHQFNDHHINTFIAVEQSESTNSFFSAFRRNYLSSTISELFAGSPIDQVTDGTSFETGRKNIFGRLNYGFKDKYLFDFNARYDGSSNFPKGKQWGFFPGASAAWRLSQENFMKNSLGFVNNLKVRASYGEIGNDAIAAFQNLRLYTLNGNGYPYGTAQAATQGLIAGVSPNPNITWEVAKTSNIGLDAGLWNDKLGISLDLFKQRRSNILATEALAIPVYTGLVLPDENIGIIENKGLELQLSHSNRINGVTYKIAGNVAYAKSKIIYLADPANVPVWQKAAGHMVGSGLYYHAIGIFRTQADVDKNPVVPGTEVGDLKYEDVNKDGVIDANDLVRMDKPSIPEITFGLNLSASYKNFSLWANFTGATRVWQYYLINSTLASNSLADLVENRYRPGSMDSKYPWLPTVTTESEVSGLHSSFWLKDASYIRLKTLELSYTLPEKLLSKIRYISSLRIYLNGSNLFTLDKLKWVDPENNDSSGNFYPQSKIFNLGINVSF